MIKLFSSILIFFSIVTALSVQAEEDISVASYNVGFLDQTLGFGLKRIYVPEYQQRLEHFRSEFSKTFPTGQQPDIIGIQELWHDDAAEVVNKVFKDNGYSAILDSPLITLRANIPHFTNHGLNIYVKSDKFSISKPEFHRITRHEGEALLRYFRGVLGAELISNKTGKRIYIGTTHLTPTIGMTDTRRSQLNEIATYLNTKTEHIVLMTGDFNASPTFKFSIENRKREGSSEEWQENGSLYSIFIDESKMIDTYTEIESDDGFTQDRVRNSIANFSASTKNEPEQRIDYVLYRTNIDTVCTTKNSNLFFTEPITTAGGDFIYAEESPESKVFLSDHFGVLSKITCN